MKKFIIGNIMKHIKNNTNYNEIKLAEIEYGLTSIYLTFSKMFIISILALVLGIFKEMIIFSTLYNILRIPSFGLHATKSWICLLITSIFFIGIPIICILIIIPIYIKFIICSLGLIFMFKNSPADTYKRPIINKKRRKIYKIISSIFTFLYSILCFVLKDNFLINCLLFSIILQNFMISPTIYKIFKLPYNNYKNYLKEHPELQIN